MISAIVAVDRNNVIGNGKSMLWHVPEDLKRFRNITINSTVVMGYNTYRSIGKPLQKRVNIVLSRNSNLKIDGCIVLNSKGQVLEYCKNDDVFIIGGSEIYNMFKDDIQKLYVTYVDLSVSGSNLIYYPEIDLTSWCVISKEEYISNNINCRTVIYERHKDV